MEIKPTLASPHEFSSVMAALPTMLSGAIKTWGKTLIPEECIFKEKGREDEIHVTVLYGIHTNLPFKIQSLLKDEYAFQVELGKVSIFTNNPFDVVKIEAFGPSLHYLNKYLSGNLEVEPSPFSYRPHVTIAYVKNNSVIVEDTNFFKGFKWMVNTLTFSSRDGSKTRIRLKETKSA